MKQRPAGSIKAAPNSQLSPLRLFSLSLLGMSLLSVALFLSGVVRGNGWADWYLLWNLFLAWIPFGLAVLLVWLVRKRPLSSWSGIGLLLAWMLFLPNSFYMVSDYIHLEDMARVNVLYDALTFTSFVINGLMLGYASLFIIQALLRKRMSRTATELFAGVMLLLCSFAIYLGRDLRWNSWDVLVNPAGILFDVSERVIDPLGHPEAFTMTLLFFIFLGGMYWSLFHATQAIGRLARSRTDWF